MRRRELIALLGGAAAWPLAARGQLRTDPLRVGFLGAASQAGYESRVGALRSGLRDLGYVEGRNLVVETRWAENNYDRLVDLASELVRIGSHVIVTHGTPGTRAAKQATATVPIVMAMTGDAVATKLVASLSRPGGNVTGSSFFSPELTMKKLELLKEIVPRMRRAAFLVNPANPVFAEVEQPLVSRAARSLGVELEAINVRAPADFGSAFSTMTERRVEVIDVGIDGMLSANAAALAALALEHGLPAAAEAEFPAVGGMIGYGPSFIEMFRRAAYFIDKIAKGVKPDDLPVEQPTKFELTFNLKTAKSLGLEISPMLLARADEVIE
jgi:putative ABC transport system substrate-binding protein